MVETSQKVISGLAAPPPRAVIESSDELTERLSAEGLMSRRSIYESTAIERNLMLAGRRAHMRNPIRAELQVHLDYWAAVNRIRAAARQHERLLIEEFAREVLPTCDPRDFFAQASSGDGLSGREVSDLEAHDEQRDQVTAINCRLLRGRISRSALDHVQIEWSSLIGIDLCDIEVGVLDASQLAVYRIKLDLCVGKRATFAHSTFRESTLRIRAQAGAQIDFSWTDLTTNGTQSQLELLALAQAENVEVDEADDAGAVAFDDCDIPRADFQRAFLQGAKFTNCHLQGANFDGADLTGAEFSGCDLTDVRFGHHEGKRGETEAKSAVLENTVFKECTLTRADRAQADGAPVGWG